MSPMDDMDGCSGADDRNAPAPKPPPTMADVMESMIKPRPDELNLAGLLNVLDGVVDTPGRLLVMTSNHPDKLDPAQQMVEHYFDTRLDARQRARCDAILAPTTAERAGPRISPALLE